MNQPHPPAGEHGKPATAPIPTSEREEPQRLRDGAGIAEAQAREAREAREAISAGGAMSHDEFMARLEEEDRRETAASAIDG
ncbi:hypothetical protein AB0H69_14210 [Streptomyces phaeochromogenes]|uniref:hypothetical protein n=1 Tax=Streptomyces phaeochromogenes TaxID=1923 RepID=UPI0033F8F484